ncbi:ribosome-associated translation inhibitor RaiA [Gottfriedia acidiceleris]|uniref:ribosome hibernation-promoting factor, HPF/YfiA family n=1 Tax=Gottfriedia acidiceleris TaxID=371036 RepID=UPI003395C70E
MMLNIRGENIEITPAIRDYVDKKLSRFDRYFDEELTARVNAKVFHDKQRIEVTIPGTYMLLRAEEEHADLYAAVDLVIDKLDRQIRKHKTKVNRKLREKGSLKFMFAPSITESAVAVEEQENDIELVRTKQFDLKPMDAEEAVLQMNMLGHNFFVFLNCETNKTNIVYARKDGRYGLIESK